ncbi:hypothetical protein ABEB36_000214 [Hypothenemus hampei]|uniref:Uncharacterized protein n=1 Tax=Hypothenemus hampei TaxID=57062 RepID=A0ABD1FAL7_HYPHA
MGLINQKATVELPSGWNEQIIHARNKPTPFVIVDCEHQSIFRSWTNHLQHYFFKKCPFESRPIKELMISEEHPRIMEYRESYNGPWTTSVVIPPRQNGKNKILPIVPISIQKYENLQDLQRYCQNSEAKRYYQNLPHS